MPKILEVIGYATDYKGVHHAYASDGHALCSQYADLFTISTDGYVTCVACMRAANWKG